MFSQSLITSSILQTYNLFYSYKGDRLINDDDERVKIIQDKDHAGFYEMIIADVNLEDAGEYRCVASNKYSDECCSCIVNVKSA